ncbi:MAG TPA: DUF885 domain-containing protein [Longimicrobiales bacterium]
MAGLAALLDEFFAYWWHAHPEDATAVGIHTHDGQFERYDAASVAERIQHFRDYIDAFEHLTPRNAGEALDRALVLDQIRLRLHDLDDVRVHTRNPLVYLDPPLSALYLMATREYAPAEDRARAAADRLRALPAVLDDARENLTDVAPVFVRTAAAVARSGLVLLETALPLGLGSALEDDVAEFARWDNALRGAESALGAFARWLEEDLAPRASGDFAIGRAAFEARLRYAHGLTEPVDTLRAFGERLKRETEAALAAVAREIDDRRDWRALIESLKDDHPPADGLIEAYANEMARARAFVEERELVEMPAGEDLEVTATPEFLRPLIPFAAYEPPAPHETEQKGLFLVTPPPPGAASSLRDHPRNGIAVTALHEAYPGHHLQLVWSNRAESEPRRVFRTSIFAEGWALYAEELMWEHGFYTDPRERLLQLKDLLWRACRVVVDIGLHVGGWSVEQAVDYLVREAGLERANAEVEVHRYCAEPTQPLSYAVGKREILRLRELSRARAGERFRLREFHDRLLSWGTIPPALIARGMGLA